jgi:hypothetical protein
MSSVTSHDSRAPAARRVAAMSNVTSQGGRASAKRRVGPRALSALFRRQRGQASVELIALLPIVFLIGLAVMALLAARSAAGEAGAAAQAGAMALIQDDDPQAAARAALPSSARERAKIRVHGRRVTVTVRPKAKPAFLAGTLASTAAADAGPEPVP